jgi:hypothetical protein
VFLLLAAGGSGSVTVKEDAACSDCGGRVPATAAAVVTDEDVVGTAGFVSDVSSNSSTGDLFLKALGC